MLKLLEVETDHGFYYSEQTPDKYGIFTKLTLSFFNGKIPELSFHKDWVKTTERLETLEKLISQPNINHRYELIDKSLESDKFPAVISDIDNFPETLASLYKFTCDKQDDILVPEEFEIVKTFKVDKLDETKFSYPITLKDSWRIGDKPGVVTDTDVKHQLMDQLVFPNLALSSRPCKLTSTQVYAIIRDHVNLNINPKYAYVSSNYDFHFEVKKKIGLAKPEAYEVDVNNSWFSKRRKPKYVTKYRSHRDVSVLELKQPGHDYKSASLAPEIEASNITELKEKVDQYLEDLMSMINEPLKDCSECKGLGVILCLDSVKLS